VNKIIPFLLAIVLLWQGLGSFVYFQFERRNIRKEIKTRLKAGVPKEDLVEFRFSSLEFKQLEWRKSNEFVWESHFYDIIEKQNKSHDSVALKCISDKQEDKLFASLGMMVSSGLHKKHPNSSPVHWKSLTDVMYILPVQLTFKVRQIRTSQEHLYTYVDTHSSIHPLKIEKPPSS
jgi:hypothetical protein